MRGVGAGVATLVVAVDHQVQTHELVELSVVEAQHAVEVGRVVQARVVGVVGLAEVRVAINKGRHLRQAGDEVHAVLVGVLPVGRLVDALGVLLGEDALGVHGGHGGRQLGHGVGVLEVEDELAHVLGHLGARVKLGGDAGGLGSRGDLTSHKQP